MRDFVRTWYDIISKEDQCALYIQYLMVHAIGALANKAQNVKFALFLVDDVCEALRYHLHWYTEMVARAHRQRPGAFRLDGGALTLMRLNM